MDITFHNITVTVSADTPQEAYKKLCEALGTENDLEFMTDTYELPSGATGSTSELWWDQG